jgi:hypothetical protein
MSQPLLSPALNSTTNAPSPDGKDLAQIENALDARYDESDRGKRTMGCRQVRLTAISFAGSSLNFSAPFSTASASSVASTVPSQTALWTAR